ncbi:hypothetical protein DRE_04279 [Drechslerella stenobrocha 248]|uniref:phospholipase D n=1 Tax=Drechslerella stenobrocha 248 TaxID=1043628 RepID=W7HRA8_9PEZI|nr:hypothetical protein DRE_04279 [Drechslerella stenobrocha 248]
MLAVKRFDWLLAFQAKPNGAGLLFADNDKTAPHEIVGKKLRRQAPLNRKYSRESIAIEAITSPESDAGNPTTSAAKLPVIMGRSRSRSRQRGDYDDSERRRSQHKSKDRSRSKSRDRDKYEGETKEERRARRHRKREEEKAAEYSSRVEQENPGSGYAAAGGGYDYQTTSGYSGAAPYPADSQESSKTYGTGEYQPGAYQADSYAQSQYAAGGQYPPATESADYNASYQAGYSNPQESYSHPGAFPTETEPYGPQPHESSYGPQPQDAPYGPQPNEPSYEPQPHEASHRAQPHEASYGSQPHDASYGPQPHDVPYGPQPHNAPYGAPAGEAATYYSPSPQPTNQYSEPRYDGAAYSTSETPYPNVPGQFSEHAQAQSQDYYAGPAAAQGHRKNPAQPHLQMDYNEAPRNPSSHPSYNPRPEPSGAPPEAEPEFELATPMVTEPQWQPTAQPQKEKSSFFKSFTKDIHDAVRGITSAGSNKAHHSSHEGGTCTNPNHFHSDNRFDSFADAYHGNRVKWFVDGKDYCWAVAEAISHAQHSIWILDWWLSPELHLRRPGAKYGEYRLDRMLHAAAQRGVQVNIIVYKEVTQALTLSSAHTKHFLEDLHPNIAVFRHPDHTPDGKVVLSKLISGRMLETLSGLTNTDQLVLYWAHHEKLCLIDGAVPGRGIAFMGGLDLCFGRWDLPHHPIADVHPADIQKTLFMGQDYNNARFMDFHTVDNWSQNKLRRTESSRMGWADISLCLAGESVEDLKIHFMERWNFIWRSKYSNKDKRYHELTVPTHPGRPGGHSSMGPMGSIGSAAHKIKGGMQEFIGHTQDQRGGYEEGRRGGYQERGNRRRQDEYDDPMAFGDSDEDRKERRRRRHEKRAQESGHSRPERHYAEEQTESYQYAGEHAEISQQSMQFSHGAKCQIVRSISPWSHNQKTEHSIQNAYIQIISSAHHFIYIENQFFITATTSDGGWPVKNRIGEAIVNRIVKAHRQNEKFRIIVIMPSVPAFAGDLEDPAALATRAIMEFQYDSISRGGKGNSIYERLAAQGINPMDYIRFFNLRNYDRINISRELESAEQATKLEYEVAQQALENKLGAGWPSAQTQGGELDQWGRAQGGVSSGVWDSVAQCSMLGGGDIRDAPWSGDPDKEIDAFVSEELYIHSKVLIADDRIVVCGSANLNDRSQNGDHDSEIAIIVEDHTPLQSLMNGQGYTASHFAGSLRRYLFRKHLGLVPAQAPDVPDSNMYPVPAPNIYDFDSEEDKLVMDPLSDRFWDHWNTTAKRNTDVFSKVFHAVPYDGVLNWDQYKDYFGKYFNKRGTKENPEPPMYPWGHVVKEEFPPGAEGARAVKAELAKVRGSLVEMSLKFMQDVDFAVEAASFNAMTEAVYI